MNVKWDNDRVGNLLFALSDGICSQLFVFCTHTHTNSMHPRKYTCTGLIRILLVPATMERGLARLLGRKNILYVFVMICDTSYCFFFVFFSKALVFILSQ